MEYKPDEQTEVEDMLRQAHEGHQKEAKKKRGPQGVWLVLLRVALMLLGIWLIIFIVSRATLYPSIGDMLADMWENVQIMWQRVTS